MSIRVAVVAAVGVLACATPVHAQVKSVKSASPTRTTTRNQPVAKQECERFALALEESVRLREATLSENAVDWNALYARATNGVPATDKARRTFREAADGLLLGQDGLLGGAIAAVAAGGSFKFLRVVENGTGTTALFRLTHADGGVPEYMAFLVEGDEDGAGLATDVDIAGEGGLLSLRLRRYFLALSSETIRNLEDKVRGHDKLDVRYAKGFDAAQEAFAAGENERCVFQLQLLPEEMKSDRAVVLLNLDASRALGDDAFRDALADARRRFPSDIAVERRALDHFLLTNSFANARATVRALNAAVGGDPYLDWLLAGVEDASGDLEAARAACRRAIEREPTLEDAWWTMLSYAVRQEKWSEASFVLQRMDARFEIDWKALSASPFHAAFFASAEGRELLAARTSR